MPLQRDGGAGVQLVELTVAGARKAKRLREIDKVQPIWNAGYWPDASERHTQVVSLAVRPVVSGSHSDGSTFSDGPRYAQPDIAGVPEPVSSEAWTGISSTAVLEGEKLEQLKAFVVDAERKLQYFGLEGNHDRAQALALIAAIRIVSEAPEPPALAIKELLAALNNLAGIASFLMSFGALMVALSK